MMSAPLFRDRPHIPLLQWLARGSLKQNLLRAIRLWVWLSTLYGDAQDSEPFTYSNWRDAFFTPSHPKGEEIPNLHDPNCRCAKTVADWLFDTQTGVSEPEWRQALLCHDNIGEKSLNSLLKRRLFGVTRRSLQGDLETLAELGWLEYREQRYYRVSQFPQYPIENDRESEPIKTSQYSFNFLHPELANIAQNHSREVRGVHRFFLHLDYVIPKSTIDLVDDWQYRLRELWEQNPVPPVKLTYQSARVRERVECIVYPVSIYYVQRAVYLCAFGETPTQKGEWYNYRLDRIKRMQPLQWENLNLPRCLRQSYPKQLPQPEEIEEKMAAAWGFDFYLEPKWMLLRFDRSFDRRYIRETFRHETFQAISYQQAVRLIQQQTPNPNQQQSLLKAIGSRCREDAYYRAYYRDGDTNVELRLRSWRPKGEVLLPWELRHKIAREVAAEAQLYLQEFNEDENTNSD